MRIPRGYASYLSTDPGVPPSVTHLVGSPDPGRAPELADARKLASRVLRGAVSAARADERVTPAVLLAAHLGQASLEADIVTEQWDAYETVNVQVGVDAWLEERERTLVGVSAPHMDADLGMLLRTAEPYLPTPSIRNVTRVNVAAGPKGATIACVQSGLYLVTDGEVRLALFQRTAEPSHGREQVSLEIVASEPGAAAAAAQRIRELVVERNVFRGQVLSFGQEMFGFRASPLVFHERQPMEREQLVLDDDILAAIERQVVGIAHHKQALRRAGQHLKRGVLLYGPPGVGKTHTARYLTSQLADTTVVILSGAAISAIGVACSVARQLQPSLVIVEDVDLIAEERTRYGGEQPLLFELLNEMDGVAGDADVAFLLTTNRADLLEPALAARPGRVDHAVELTLPDLDARKQLFELYRGALVVTASAEEVESLLARAEGVTASFVKEFLRRTALRSAERRQPESSDEELTVSVTDLTDALDELLHSRNRMTRSLLGTVADRDDEGEDDVDWPAAGVPSLGPDVIGPAAGVVP